MEPSERELMRSSARQLLATAKPDELPDALVELGWVDLLDADVADAATILAEEQGGLRAATPALDMVMQHAAGLALSGGRAIVLPPVARGASRSGTYDRSDGLAVEGIMLAGRDHADTLLVLTDRGVVTVPASAFERQPISGADPELGLAGVRGSIAAGWTTPLGDERATDAAIDAGRRWLASELVGLADRMLADAVAYVSVRHQYGRPIGSFQAVKHRLADVRVAVAGARAAVSTAWADRTSLSALASKCLAGRAHAVAAMHCHQVQGGIAFTVEHGFHRWIQRGFLLDGLLGSARQLAHDLGLTLVAEHALPRSPAL